MGVLCGEGMWCGVVCMCGVSTHIMTKYLVCSCVFACVHVLSLCVCVAHACIYLTFTASHFHCFEVLASFTLQGISGALIVI